MSESRPPAPKRAQLAGKSRQAVIWALGSFAVLQLGLAIGIETRLPELRDPYYGFKRQRLEGRLSDGPDRLVVMLGSSRTAFGLRAGDLERQLSADLDERVVAFNFGIPAAGPVMELLNFKRLMADGIRPDFLLVEVLPPLFCGQMEVPAEARWLPADRLWHRELSLLEQIGFPVKGLRTNWWQGWPVPWHAHRFAIVSAFAPNWLPWNLRQDWGRGTDDHGWSAPLTKDTSPERRREATERARKEYDHYLNRFRLGKAPCQALRELLDECRRQNVPVALVLMPEGPAFQSWYSPRTRQQIDRFLAGLQEDYQVPLIDARSWVPEEGFSDSHHLLVDGAATFTERLGRQELVPLMRGPAIARQAGAEPMSRSGGGRDE